MDMMQRIRKLEADFKELSDMFLKLHAKVYEMANALEDVQLQADNTDHALDVYKTDMKPRERYVDECLNYLQRQAEAKSDLEWLDMQRRGIN